MANSKDDPELKGEHFAGNNKDMKLYFEKPSEAEIADMEAKKSVRGFPITHNEAIDVPGNSKDQQFMLSDGSGKIAPREVPTSVARLKNLSMTGEEEDLPEP